MLSSSIIEHRAIAHVEEGTPPILVGVQAAVRLVPEQCRDAVGRGSELDAARQFRAVAVGVHYARAQQPLQGIGLHGGLGS